MKQYLPLLGLIALGLSGAALAEPDCLTSDPDCPISVPTVMLTLQPEAATGDGPEEVKDGERGRRIVFGSEGSKEGPQIKFITRDKSTAPARDYDALSRAANAERARREAQAAADGRARDILLDAMDVPENQRDKDGEPTCETIYNADGSETRSCSAFKTFTLSSD